METKEVLRGVDLFKNLTDSQLDRLVGIAIELSFSEGPITRDNDDADGLYIVKSGMLKVSKGSADTLGVEAVLAILRPGNSFGEIGLIDGLPRSANVVAMGPIVCYFLPRDAFMLMLKETPEIAFALLPALAAMVRSADQWVAQLV